ncbi:hypothetical protein B0T17DRAFT_200416 [Bombardia bombarda]|uniref:Cyclin-dependent kinase n=1 Tax=Bombardia bombarda TaxID=252184 RepID=A0AA39XAF8_9PEZI|nr:hypothetical protein B0T17DRAFT_200416 [Bombardia bombarda]
MDSSPTKRRVLGPLDPNASSPSSPMAQQPGFLKLTKPDAAAITARPPPSSGTTVASTTSISTTQSAVSAATTVDELPSPDPETRKRPLKMPPLRPGNDEDDDGLPAQKRPCLGDEDRTSGSHDEMIARKRSSPVKGDPEEESQSQSQSQSPSRYSGGDLSRQRSASPAASSIFDSSAMLSTSQDTTITEPDAELLLQATAAAAAATTAAGPPVRRRTGSRLTREEAREKAEILRLRLGLANYKVRTGQTDVPLERLQMRRLSGSGGTYPSATTTSLPPLRSSAGVQASQSSPLDRQSYTGSSSSSSSSRRPLPSAPTPGVRSDEAELARRRQQQQQQQRAQERSAAGVEEEMVDDDDDGDVNGNANGGTRRKNGSGSGEGEGEGPLSPALPRLPLPRQPPAEEDAPPPSQRRNIAEEEMDEDGGGGAASGLLSLSRG